MCSPSARTGRISSNKRIHPTATAIPFRCLMESEYSSVVRALVLRTKPHSMITHPSLTVRIFIMNADGINQVTSTAGGRLHGGIRSGKGTIRGAEFAPVES